MASRQYGHACDEPNPEIHMYRSSVPSLMDFQGANVRQCIVRFLPMIPCDDPTLLIYYLV